MTTHDHDDGLDAEAHAALLGWLATDVPAGFADRVLARGVPPVDDDAPLLPPLEAVPAPPIDLLARRRRLQRWLAAGIAMLAAAAFVLLLGTTLRARAEADDRALRVAADEFAPSAELAALRGAALATLAEQCTPCHAHSHDDAVSGALAVFDVEDPRWHVSMSDRQLEVAARRIETSSADAAERAGFRSYVDAEIAHRRATGGRAAPGT